MAFVPILPKVTIGLALATGASQLTQSGQNSRGTTPRQSGGLAWWLGGLGGMLGDLLVGKQPTQASNAHQEIAAALMLKAMVQAAKAGRKLDQSEKQKLMQNLGEADPKENAIVNDLLAQPVDIDMLVNATPRGLEEQVYLRSLMAIDLDSQPEAQYLRQLATALGFDQASFNQIHDQADAQRLYS